MRKTLACLLIPTFITFYNTNKANALSTEVENKVINNINNDTNEDNFSLMTRYLNYELEYQRDTFQAKIHRDIKSRELIKQKVNGRIDKQIERQEKEEQERIEKENSYNIVFTITHYGLSSEENGGFVGLNCQNNPLRSGMVANNTLPLGTIIEFENGERVIVADRGGSDFNNSTRLDKFVPTYDNNYLMKLGRYAIKGKIITKG